MKSIALPTATIIGKTPEQYQLDVFNIYFNYCQSKSINDAGLQMLLISKPFNNWFMREFHALEHTFKKDVKPFISNSHPQELFKIWKQTVVNIFLLHSFPTIKVTPQAINNWKPQLN